jgi:hypothetical protein
MNYAAEHSTPSKARRPCRSDLGSPRCLIGGALLTAFLTLTACGSSRGKAEPEAVALPDSCDVYVKRFQDCLTKSNPRAADDSLARAEVRIPPIVIARSAPS